MNDYIAQFRSAMESAGLTPPNTIVPDGKIHRFATNGKINDNAGWYLLHADGIPAGTFGDWRSGMQQNWRANLGRDLTPLESAQYRARMDMIRRERENEEAKRKAEARERAVSIWEAAPLASETHAYLLAKGVKAHGDLRLHEGDLVVPVREGGELQSLQFISDDGQKRFMVGGRVSGCYFMIGEPVDVLCVAEGYATAASIHAATGHAVAVAFNAGNLLPAAKALRKRFPDVRLVFCADDDASTEGNPGLSSAREAARALGSSLAVPDFRTDRPKGATDFNDLHRHHGLEAVKACIERATTVPDEPESVIYRRISDVAARPIHWLWPGRFARGKVSMIAGNPGLGKSQVTANIAAVVTTGGLWPVDNVRCEEGSVIFLSAEDDPSDTIKPRLLAAGADTNRCYVLDAVTDLGPDEKPRPRSFNLQRDVGQLSKMLGELGDVALIVIDPISAYMGGTDTHRNSDVRAVLAPLAELAARHDVAVICISHLNKASGGAALMRVTGSLAFVAAARAAHVVTQDQGDPQRRLLLPLKNNIGDDQAGLAFHVEPVEVDGSIQTSRVAWEPEAASITADEAMRLALPEEETQRDEIAAWLHDLLCEGRMHSREVKRMAVQAGFAWRSVQRACKQAEIVIEREGFGSETATYWSLESVAPSSASCASAGPLARVDGIGATGDSSGSRPDSEAEMDQPCQPPRQPDAAMHAA